MAISVFDIFKIGIGPSSSHTVGPMRAAATFAGDLERRGLIGQVLRIRVELFGSLAATGKGHGTDNAVLLGLEGEAPDLIDPTEIPERLAAIRDSGRIRLLRRHAIAFNEKSDLLFLRKVLPYHSNGMRFTAYAGGDHELIRSDYYSVGGGFVVTGVHSASDRLSNDDTCLPYPFKTGAEMLKLCRQTHLPVSALMMANEKAWLDEQQIRQRLIDIWRVMQACVERGMREEGLLPGGMKVKRRAAALYKQLTGEIPGKPQICRSAPWIGSICSRWRSARKTDRKS
ncbi:MAG: serine dehydratase beta chain, partial [Methylomonas sp.]|nr:serine dehydratase beta chain [Methylomonas sp.]